MFNKTLDSKEIEYWCNETVAGSLKSVILSNNIIHTTKIAIKTSKLDGLTTSNFVFQ